MDELVPIDKRTKQFAIRIVKLYNSTLFHFSLFLFTSLILPSLFHFSLFLFTFLSFSFSTACRFARALEMDFLPGLAPSKKRSPNPLYN